jgi:hypothetical protein
MPDFAHVKHILDSAIDGWKARTGRSPNLARHDLQFGWNTREQLLSAQAFGLPLIAEEHIQNRTGDEANLIIALRRGVAPFPRMPIQGPYLDEDSISEIVDWINQGAPE